MKSLFVFFSVSVFLIFLTSCGDPHINSLTPVSGPPHTIVETQGDLIFTSILWNADATPDILPGGWLGGGPFSVPDAAPLGNHKVAAERSGRRSAMVDFNVTAPLAPFPNPSITHLSSLFSEALVGNQVKFILFAQGPNIDVGAKILVNGVDQDAGLWRVLRYNSAGYNPATLKYPIFHYTMIYTSIEATVGDILAISVKNLDNNLSNVLNFTVPAQADWDSDGDGLLDTWEETGFDRENDGTIECNLPAMGANKFVYDVFAEVDFMDGAVAANPDKIPNNGTWAIVEQSFANAPLMNPLFGLQGIQIHIDRGQNTYTDLQNTVFNIPASEIKGGEILPYFDYIRMDGNPTTFAAVGETTQNFYTFKGTNFNSGRKEIFHYSIFANKHGHTSGSTGRGETFGNDLFITVSDARLTSANNSAGTFLHELGHNLNLHHGGDDDLNTKPNHVSVMSYFTFDGTSSNSYQFAGVDTDCNLTPNGMFDYSHGMLNDLDETALNENAGICNNTAVDWNGDAVFQNPVNFNIDATLVTLLKDHNNWGPAFLLNFRLSADYVD